MNSWHKHYSHMFTPFPYFSWFDYTIFLLWNSKIFLQILLPKYVTLMHAGRTFFPIRKDSTNSKEKPFCGLIRLSLLTFLVPMKHLSHPNSDQFQVMKERKNTPLYKHTFHTFIFISNTAIYPQCQKKNKGNCYYFNSSYPKVYMLSISFWWYRIESHIRKVTLKKKIKLIHKNHYRKWISSRKTLTKRMHKNYQQQEQHLLHPDS